MNKIIIHHNYWVLFQVCKADSTFNINGYDSSYQQVEKIANENINKCKKFLANSSTIHDKNSQQTRNIEFP